MEKVSAYKDFWGNARPAAAQSEASAEGEERLGCPAPALWPGPVLVPVGGFICRVRAHWMCDAGGPSTKGIWGLLKEDPCHSWARALSCGGKACGGTEDPGRQRPLPGTVAELQDEPRRHAGSVLHALHPRSATPAPGQSQTKRMACEPAPVTSPGSADRGQPGPGPWALEGVWGPVEEGTFRASAAMAGSGRTCGFIDDWPRMEGAVACALGLEKRE